MTENERFILCNKTTDSNVWDTLEKQCYGWEYVVFLLNRFDGTIKDLSDDYEQLLKENKELKDKLCELGVSDVKGIDTGLEDWLND